MASPEEQSFLGPGDFVGVIPCMSGHNQIESVVALTDVVAISVRRDQYTELIQKNTPVALKIIRTFANKMRLLNDTLTRLTLKNSAVSSPEHLFSVASYYEKAGMIDPAIYAYYQYLKACPHGANVENAKRRFIVLKPRSHAVYFEPPADPIRTYPKNTMVFCEDQSGQDMFIIQEGQIKISKVVEGNEVILAVLKKGEFFGEMALLENMPRSASAIAFEDCRLMTVNRQNFNQMVTTQAQLIAKLTTTLADRLWSTTRQLENTQILDPLHRLFDMLALQLEKERVQCASGITHHFDFSPYDLANMCGIPQEQQAACLRQFMTDSRIRIENNKIEIPDTLEIVKSAEFYRKQVR
jgi:cAMP-binding proteins - catabolite gene activator and regulatory subunit of cAMP-dependent protein kinases